MQVLDAGRNLKAAGADVIAAKSPFAGFVAVITQYATLLEESEFPVSRQFKPLTEYETAIVPDPPEEVRRIGEPELP